MSYGSLPYIKKDHSGERPLKQVAVIMNLYKAAFKEEIHEVLKMHKYGLRFLTEKECKALESYSRARWNIQGASLLREEYQRIMVTHTLQGDET